VGSERFKIQFKPENEQVLGFQLHEIIKILHFFCR